MAIHNVGTNTTTSLRALTYSPSAQVLPPNNIGDLSQTIVGDGNFASSNAAPAGPNTGGPIAVLATGNTYSNQTVDTLVSTGGGPLASIFVGMLVVSGTVPLGTFVQAILSPTSIMLSKNAVSTTSPAYFGFCPPSGRSENLSYNGLLVIPRRGILKVLPGDVPCIDNTGWPILLSAATIAYPGSEWTFT